MFTKKVLVSALFAAGMIGAAAIPLSSLAEVDVVLNFGPPAVQYEAVPAPRNGYVWSNGYWQWDGSSSTHVWAPGTWQASRSGYVYSQPRWVENNGRWNYQPSRWDRDGDGVPNRQDSRPNDPNRR